MNSFFTIDVKMNMSSMDLENVKLANYDISGALWWYVLYAKTTCFLS